MKNLPSSNVIITTPSSLIQYARTRGYNQDMVSGLFVNLNASYNNQIILEQGDIAQMFINDYKNKQNEIGNYRTNRKG